MVTDASPRSLLVRLFGRTALDDDARQVLRRYSPIHGVHRGMPPVLLVHGTNERLWDQGVAMARALEQARVPSELIRLEGAPHGMENWEGVEAWSGYKARVVRWLQQQMPQTSQTRQE
jgi:acetyl esterase/lipase